MHAIILNICMHDDVIFIRLYLFSAQNISYALIPILVVNKS
jgi:hypothetical protein